VRTWILYSVIRLGIFAAVFALLLWLLGALLWWLAAVCAALIALSISYIALGRLRARMTADLAARAEQRRSAKRVDPDADAEDAESEDAAASERDRPAQ